MLLTRIAYYYPSVSSPGLVSNYTEAVANGTRSLQHLLALPETGQVDADTWVAAEAVGLGPAVRGHPAGDRLAAPAAGGMSHGPPADL